MRGAARSGRGRAERRAALALSACRLGAALGLAACTQPSGPAPAPAPVSAAPSAATPAAAPSSAATPPAPTSAAAGAPAASDSVLRVGTSGDYAPFSSIEASGQRSGFDVELAERLASDLGLELRWVAFRWPELARQLGAGDFDVAMGGVSWQPARDAAGYMTRARARGGPGVLGAAAAARIAVNRGGVLEAWARSHLVGRELVSVDDNLGLPELLAQGQVGAIVTDSFELHTFARPGWASHCEAPLTRKVYWVRPGRAGELGRRIDGWLFEHGPSVQAAQERWLGERQRLDAVTHLVDLLARRFAYMPLVAAMKAARGLPIEDLPREREVLDGVRRSAHDRGLPEEPVLALFALQLELSKAVQRRQSEPSSLDLGRQVRPALSALGERIVDALAEARAARPAPAIDTADLELLSPWLGPDERQRLLASVRAVLLAPANAR